MESNMGHFWVPSFDLQLNVSDQAESQTQKPSSQSKGHGLLHLVHPTKPEYTSGQSIGPAVQGMTLGHGASGQLQPGPTDMCGRGFVAERRSLDFGTSKQADLGNENVGFKRPLVLKSRVVGEQLPHECATGCSWCCTF